MRCEQGRLGGPPDALRPEDEKFHVPFLFSLSWRSNRAADFRDGVYNQFEGTFAIQIGTLELPSMS